ncbi:MAG: mgtC [Bacteroidetes bacterium]|jgi:putative Mg2+ transporter-C (MgtC) family protein|nr:mgtC [Bacteroidota bacterium]
MTTPDLQTELTIIWHLLVSILLGGFIGYDRERDGNNAGIRTYAAVCLGATIFTVIANQLDGDGGTASRIIANIITGIGFLGVGVIYRDSGSGVQGLTSAATIWATAAVGVAVGLDMFIIAVFSSLALYFLLSLHQQKWYKRWKEKIKNRKLNEAAKKVEPEDLRG